MTRFRSCLRTGLSALALAAGAASARAGVAPGLSLRGEIRGGVAVAGLPDLGLEWNAAVDAEGLVLSTLRPGAEVEIVLRPAGEGAWRWAIRRGRLDLAELWPLARSRLGAAAEGWSASGRVELSGQGTWSSDAGPAGEVSVALREGWARSDALDVEVGGVEMDLSTNELATAVLPAGQTLRVGRIAVAGADLGALRLGFGLDAARVLQILSGEATVFGGAVRLRPFRMSLAKPAVDAAADVDALNLGEAARLLPWLIQSAQGRLRGRVELAWDGEKGLRVKDGGLSIVKSDDAAFRLAPSPGLLTGKMPARFSALPWGWARWIGFANPAYAPLREIEQGKEGLRIETFRVDFRPDGPGAGRTAAIHIVGRPTSGKLVKEVKLDLNFHGPWSEFLGFGLNNELSGVSFRFE